jgi:hypothetical protein
VLDAIGIAQVACISALRKLLRVSPARLRYLIGTGILRVRDPRVTTVSLLALCNRNGFSLDHSALDRITVALSKQDAYPWERAVSLAHDMSG